MSSTSSSRVPSPPPGKRFRRLNIDLVELTPEEIAEALLKVDSTKAAAVALHIGGALGIQFVGRASQALDEAQQHPLRTAARVAGSLLDP